MAEYYAGETYLHRFDVRTKLIVFVAAMVLIFLFDDPLYNAAVALLLVAAVVPSRVPLRGVIGAMKPLVAIFVIVIAMTCFTAPVGGFRTEAARTVLFYLLPGQRVPATLGGLLIGTTYLLRIFIMVFATTVFTLTTPVDDILQFMNKAKAPYEMSIIVTTAISFIPTMMTKKDLIFQAQRARGARITGKGVFGQLKAYAPIMIPLIINSILLANNLSVAMLNRGYGANKSWTELKDIRMGRRDYAVVAAVLALVGAGIYLKAGLGRGTI
jgi:energy-coupling factor transport system permease protein